MHGNEIVAGLKMNFAIWRARTMQALGHPFRDEDDLKHFLIRAYTDARWTYGVQERCCSIARSLWIRALPL